eukprot:m.88735 g.88735  ORF g.88735 m.88735 type:complete len:148 (+) comp13185_c0_seq1:1139-1582(+)
MLPGLLHCYIFESHFFLFFFRPFSGNFCVFPGTHRYLLPLVKQQVMCGSELFSQETTPNATQPGIPPKPPLTNGVQVLAAPGDVVFAHQKLAHRGGPNYSSNIRYQVYFRLSVTNHEALVSKGAVLEDLWVEYPDEIKQMENFVAKS